MAPRRMLTVAAFVDRCANYLREVFLRVCTLHSIALFALQSHLLAFVPDLRRAWFIELDIVLLLKSLPLPWPREKKLEQGPHDSTKR